MKNYQIKKKTILSNITNRVRLFLRIYGDRKQYSHTVWNEKEVKPEE